MRADPIAPILGAGADGPLPPAQERFLRQKGLSAPYAEEVGLPLDKPLSDLLMLILLLAAFVGAVLYVRACLGLVRPVQPPRPDAK